MANTVDIATLTNGAVVAGSDGYVWEGTGIFDVLIKAVNSNIRSEFDNGRIAGSDYAQVYLNSLQAVLSQSVDYTLRKQLIEKQLEQADEDLLLKKIQAREELVKLNAANITLGNAKISGTVKDVVYTTDTLIDINASTI